MSSWPHGEKIIFLDFSGSGMQIEGKQNTVSTLHTHKDVSVVNPVMQEKMVSNFYKICIYEKLNR